MPGPTDVQRTIIESAILGDEELQEAIRNMAWKVVERANYYLNNGAPAIQISVMKNIMPAITAALRKQQEEQTLEEFKNEVRDMLKEFRGGIEFADANMDD